MNANTSLSQRLFAALLTSSLGLSIACGPTGEDGAVEVTDQIEQATTDVPGSSLRRFITDSPFGCSPAAWFGGFPLPKPWISRDLFQYAGVKTPGHLRDYCLYKYDGKGDPQPGEVAALHAYLDQFDLVPFEDTVVTGPLSLDQELRGEHHGVLLKHAGALKGAWPQGQKTWSPVRLAFADSSPEDKSGTIPHGRLAHGSILAWLARDLSTPSVPWSKAVHPTLVTTGIALPQVDNDIEDISNGGYFGTRGQLAEAIYRVTAGWLLDSQDPNTRQERLVVNLSVGWEPEDKCATATDKHAFEVPTKAAFDAVSYVSCLGGLVVAAAGNDPGHLNSANSTIPSGPTCPAAWSANFEAPNYTTCAKLLGRKYQHVLADPGVRIPSTDPPAPGIDNPILYAVGGLDFTRHRIEASRADGFPKYGAIATGAAAAPPNSELPTALTGTSVSAAVASSIAAVTWTYRPELTAPEIMNLMYESGLPVGWNADFGIGSPDPVHALSLCDSVKAACEPVLGIVPDRCPSAQISCPTLPSASYPNPPLSEAQEQELPLFFAGAPLQTIKPRPLVLPTDAFQLASVAPWVHPQPLITPCSLCLFRLNPVEEIINPVEQVVNPVLYVSLDPDYTNTLDLSAAALVLRVGKTYAQSELKKLGPLGNSVALQGESFIVDFGSMRMGHIWSASISWKSTSNRHPEIASLRDPVLVSQ